MVPVVFLFLACVVSFAIGGIPFGYVVGRILLKDDIRNHGSGNIGATNVGRVLGWKWGSLVLLLDAMKGLIPTLGAAYVASTMVPPEWLNPIAVAVGLSAIIGHMYPIYLRLRGGKGVATALGVVVVLAPKATGIALLLFVVVLATSRRMALASMLAAIAFGATHLVLSGAEAWTLSAAPLTAFAIAVPVLIIWRHRANIGRLLAGTEPKITERAASGSSDTDRVTSDQASSDTDA